MSEHWRDQHRKGGRYLPKPGGKGFVPAEPREEKPPTERRPFAVEPKPKPVPPR